MLETFAFDGLFVCTHPGRELRFVQWAMVDKSMGFLIQLPSP
jgi:hypothetical protein